MEKCKGIIQEVFAGVPKDTQYGKCANYTLKIDNIMYMTYTGVKDVMPFKAGDEVEFNFEEKPNYQGVPENRFAMKDNFVNHTSPIAAKQGGFGGGSKWAPDPAKDLRICYQSVFSNIMPAVIHNHAETKITEDSIKQALKWSEAVIKRIHAFKLDIPTAVATTPQPAAPKKASAPVVEEQPPFIDDDVPF